MAKHLERSLLPTEIVHHLNGVKTDNRLENLAIMKKRDHDRLPKPPPEPIECPHCHGRIRIRGNARVVGPA